MKKKNIDEAQACRIAAAKKTSIGGQALLDGIMMRGPKMTAMAVRNSDGEIVLEKWKTVTKETPKIFKLPIIRGVYNFISSMKTGYKALMRSAEISGLEEIEAEMAREKAEKKKAKKLKKEAEKALKENVEESVVENVEEKVEESLEITEAETTESTATDTTETVAEETTVKEETESNVDEPKKKKDSKKKESSALTNTIMSIASFLGVVIAVGLFVLMPIVIFKLLPISNPDLYPHDALLSLTKAAFESIFRIVLLVGYMALVSLMKDIRKTFKYHGAEHKTIFCYENGLELTVENVRKQKRFHPRCGTAFLVLMMIVGMFVSFFIVDPIYYLTVFWAQIDVNATAEILIRLIIKIVLLPLTMGIGYELIKISGRHDNIFTRIISAPGLLLQRLTVLEPTDDMIECAITAFKEVIPEDKTDNY